MMTRRIFCALTVSLPLLLTVIPSAAADPADVSAIVRQSLQALYYGGNDSVVQVKMSLIDSNGKTRTRTLSLLRKNVAGGNQRYFIYFHSPADIADMTFLVHKFSDRDDDRWMFIPAVRMVKRIAASDKRSSFVGSDFTYEDVSGRDAQDEKSSIVRSEDLGGRPCFVVEGIPKDKATYAKRLSFIDKERLLPLREEFTNDKGIKIRTFTADEVKQVGGIWTVTKRTMLDNRSSHRTEVAFQNVRYNVGLDDGIFTESALRSPPRQWLK